MARAQQRIVTICRFYPPSDPKAPIPDARWAYMKTSEDGSRFSPHIVVGDPSQREPIIDRSDDVPELTEDYLGVGFWDGDAPIEPDKDIRIEMDLIYYPSVDYSRAQVGEAFTIRWGPRIAGYGRIVDRFDPIDPTNQAEQGGGGQPATRPDSK